PVGQVSLDLREPRVKPGLAQSRHRRAKLLARPLAPGCLRFARALNRYAGLVAVGIDASGADFGYRELVRLSGLGESACARLARNGEDKQRDRIGPVHAVERPQETCILGMLPD